MNRHREERSDAAIHGPQLLALGLTALVRS